MAKALTRKRKKLTWSVKFFIICTISLQLIHWLVFNVIMSVQGILLTMKNVDYASNTEVWVGLKNYASLFKQISMDFSAKQGWYIAIRNSLAYWPLNFGIMLPLVIIMGYFLFKKLPMRKFFIVILFIPNLLPAVALVQTVKEMFAPDYGPMNNLLMKIIGSESVIPWFNSTTYTNPILWVFSIWAGSGYFVVLLYGAFARVPQEIVEAARLDGVSFFRELWSIYIPIIWPSIITVMVTGCVSVPFGMYMHQLLFTGGQAQTETIALRNFFYLAGGDYYSSGTYSVVISLISTPIVLFFKWAMEKVFEPVEV